MRRSLRPLMVLVALQVILGAAEPHMRHLAGRPYSPLFIVIALMSCICIFTWCKSDAAERGVSAGGLATLTALFAPIGLPWYLFRTRSKAEAFWGLLRALGFWLLLTVLYTVVWYASKHIGT